MKSFNLTFVRESGECAPALRYQAKKIPPVDLTVQAAEEQDQACQVYQGPPNQSPPQHRKDVKPFTDS